MVVPAVGGKKIKMQWAELIFLEAAHMTDR